MERKVKSRTSITVIKEVVETKKNIYAIKVPIEEALMWSRQKVECLKSIGVYVTKYWDDNYILLSSLIKKDIIYLAKKYGIPELMISEIINEEVNYIEK